MSNHHARVSDSEDSDMDVDDPHIPIGNLLGAGRPRTAPIRLGEGADDIILDEGVPSNVPDSIPPNGPPLPHSEGKYNA